MLGNCETVRKEQRNESRDKLYDNRRKEDERKSEIRTDGLCGVNEQMDEDVNQHTNKTTYVFS